jgi:CHAT domain-containing protein
MRAPGRGGAGFTGLAESFLVAGAGGVIGSLWRVNDDLTDAFMREFYGAYRASGDAAAALRHAKLRMMQAPDSARHPSAWAAFRLAGR